MTRRYPPDMPGFEPGSVLAGYRLEAKVGEGGMAVVYRARDEHLHRQVALKILAPEFTTDAAFRRRFIRESEAAAGVDHPHIIPIYLAGETGGVLFISMRFVSGGDLRQVMKREGPLSAARVADIISPVASALDAAHVAGLVHRDVKPGNVLVDIGPGRPDHVLLSDFGISKSLKTGGTLTGTGQFVGTAGYSAPEQIEERAVSGRADQYALACVTWELLTGGTLFQQPSIHAVLIAHVHEQPPLLTSRRPDLPFAANDIMARALAKSPEERYPSCADFADALREVFRLPAYHAGPAVLQPALVFPAERAATWSTRDALADTDEFPAVEVGSDTESSAADGRESVAAPSPDAEQAPPAGQPPAGMTTGRRRLSVIAGAAVVVVGAAVTIPFLLKSPAGPARPQLSASPPPAATSPLRPTRIPLPASLTGSAISSLAFSPSGSMLALAGASGTCLMGVATHNCTSVAARAVSVAFSPDGTILAT